MQRAILLASSVAVLVAAVVMGASVGRPNIVLIVADDLGFSDLGCYGGEIRTPNLDRLAQGGLRYSQFYSAAKCHTSRASLMAGLYPHQTGCELPFTARRTRDSSRRVVHSGVSIASVLRGAGYATFACGKWHAGGKPTKRGFDHFFGLPGGACSYFTPARSLHRNEQSVRVESGAEFYFTDAITDDAIEVLGRHSDQASARPFFLYVAYTAPHWPLHAYEEDIARYKGAYVGGWEAIRKQRLQRLREMGIVPAQWQLPALDSERKWETVEHAAWEQRRMEVYAAMVDRMDRGIGRIVDLLREQGTLDNTVVFFLSDNGGSQEEIQSDTGFVVSVLPNSARDGRPIRAGNDPSIMPGGETTFQTVGREWGNVSNTPFRYGKVRVHEGGTASPLIVHWPGGIRERGVLRRQMSHVMDLLPTCAELAGATYPREYKGKKTEMLEGTSLVPTFKDAALPRDRLLFEMSGNRAVRTREWKAVTRQGYSSRLRDKVSIPLETWELYNIRDDRTETENLAGEYPDVLRELVKQWEVWIEEP